ncbi:MAG TPA: SMI1/KNR4 family protein [Planctomycetota bacterium]|nr:SMI1/KNR4 family protein [Planctomycetota bacterium]
MKRMRERGWKPGGPAAEGAVAQVEKEFDVSFPSDYRAFLIAAGGGETMAPESFTGLLPVGILSLFNRRYRIPWNFPGLFAIGNDGFLVYVIDYRGLAPVIASIGMSSSVWEDVVTETDTFAEWLERRIP